MPTKPEGRELVAAPQSPHFSEETIGSQWHGRLANDVTAASAVTGEEKLQVFARDNHIDQALHVLKKMHCEGVFREMKRRRFYEKPSDKSAREKLEAIRCRRKVARKQAVRDGPIAVPPKKTIARLPTVAREAEGSGRMKNV